jgi:hypothetical protein
MNQFMNRIVIIVFLLFGSLKIVAQKSVFNNESIVKLYNAGISKEVIIKKIQTSDSTSFDVSTEELIKLKTKKIPDTILLILIEKVSEKSIVNETLQKAAPKSNIKNASEETISTEKIPLGFSLFDKSKNEFIVLSSCEPSDYSENEQPKKGLFSTPLDFISSDDKIYFNGTKSTLLITDNSPIFYARSQPEIIFKGSDLEEFILYNALVDKTSRRILLGKKSNLVKPKTELFNKNIIKITFPKKLPQGSYFMCIGKAVFFEFDIVK